MLRKRSWGRIGTVLGGIALVLAAPVRACAQVGSLHPSLEAVVAPADRVFTGKVVETGADAWTIRVDENLKGSGPETVTFAFRAASPIDFKGDPLEKGRSYLWAVGPADPKRWGPLLGPAGLRQGGLSTPWLLVDLDGTTGEYHRAGRYALPMFTEDLGVVRSRKAALARVRAFVRTRPEPVPLLMTMVPNDFVRRQGIDPNAFAMVVLPQDAAAERAALRFLDRPEEFFGKARPESDPTRRAAFAAERRWWIVHTREEGIRLLAPFRSPANEARLRRLLADPSLLPDPMASSDAAPWVYNLRRAAYDVLRGWGVDVPPPAFNAPRP